MRKRTIHKAAAALTALALCAGVLTGCGGAASSTTASSTAGSAASSEVSGEEADELAAKNVADLIDAIYVQERTDDTDAQCEAAKAAWDALTDADMQRLDSCGQCQASYVKLHFDEHKAFTSLYFLEAGRSVAQVRQAAQTLLHDAKYGHVLRVKGFIPDGGGWVELNAARDAITVQPIPSGQEVLIVIGEGLDKAAIEAAVRGC